MKHSKFYVTTPIYYVNDKPHIGHAYTTILADVLARYHRLQGIPTWFLTGTDEHGQKVQRAAEKAGMTPQQQADSTVVHFQALWKRLHITHDDFIRTTEERHKRVVQACLQDLYDKGEIYKAEYDGLYDVTSETFVTEKDLPPGKSPEELPNIVRIKESNYFFRMSKYQQWLIDYIHAHPEFIQPDFRRNETLGFLRKPLQDLCISRPKSRLSWGIELPFDRDYVCYVWFDALVNYISAIGYKSDPAKFEQWWPAEYHLIGKDILTTHTVYWPTMLKALDVPLPKTVFAHGWWLSGDTKMSKSLGNVVNPMDMIDRYGVDAFRYFLMAEMVLGQDASFTEDAFQRRYNADLANDLGNLLSRLTNMIRRYCGGFVPALPAGELDPESAELRAAVQTAVDRCFSAIDSMRVDQALADVLSAVKRVNKYLEVRQPWSLAKLDDKAPLNTCLYVACESLRILSSLLQPVMPAKMEELRSAIGLRGSCRIEEIRQFGIFPAGREVREIGALFPRIEREPPTAAPARPEMQAASASASTATAEASRIDYGDFAKIQLRTAKILQAERVAGADKLLKLSIQVGEETRQIVAGIAKHYAPESLVGKTIVVVANLKPAKIRGIESNGMLLAASAGDQLRLITVDGEMPSGAVVK
ncbi:MAG: methionine--tRNA ligase [Kiritimatiellae bacterium]|nr:methionine--tRNA ligase [Kiritimatiellia bacterium]MDW8458221.1 methionine--tRNA ligase [Verrucomicrobiota bacterium]